MQTTFNVTAEGREAQFQRQALARRGFGMTARVEEWEHVRPRLIPWIEVNKREAVDAAVAGLLEWSHIADTAIVTTVPGELDIYDEISGRVPELQIIPGLKTNDLLRKGFDNMEGWERIGHKLEDMAQRCGSDTVVLENESAVRKYGLGNETLDWDTFRKAMEELPRDREIIWYPAITGADDESQNRMQKLCCAVVKHHPRVTLVDRGFSNPAAVRWNWSKEARLRLALIGAPTIPMLYFYGPDEDYWQDEQIHKALEHVKKAAEVIIYPGAARFEDAAKGIRKALEAGGG